MAVGLQQALAGCTLINAPFLPELLCQAEHIVHVVLVAQCTLWQKVHNLSSITQEPPPLALHKIDFSLFSRYSSSLICLCPRLRLLKETPFLCDEPFCLYIEANSSWLSEERCSNPPTSVPNSGNVSFYCCDLRQSLHAGKYRTQCQICRFPANSTCMVQSTFRTTL